MGRGSISNRVYLFQRNYKFPFREQQVQGVSDGFIIKAYAIVYEQ